MELVILEDALQEVHVAVAAVRQALYLLQAVQDLGHGSLEKREETDKTL